MKKNRRLGLICLFWACFCVAKGQYPLHLTFCKSKSNFQNFIKTNKIAYIQEDAQVDSFSMISKSYQFDTIGNMISFGESGQKWATETIYTYDENNNLTTELRKETTQIVNGEGKLTESESEILKIYEYQNNQLVSILDKTTGEKIDFKYERIGDTLVKTAFYIDMTEVVKYLPQKEITITSFPDLREESIVIKKYDRFGNLIHFEMPSQFDSSASSVFTSEYEYNEDGNALKKIEKIFNTFHKGSTSRTVIYRYDLRELEKIESVAWEKLKENRYFQYRYQSRSIRKN